MPGQTRSRLTDLIQQCPNKCCLWRQFAPVAGPKTSANMNQPPTIPTASRRHRFDRSVRSSCEHAQSVGYIVALPVLSGDIITSSGFEYSAATGLRIGTAVRIHSFRPRVCSFPVFSRQPPEQNLPSLRVRACPESHGLYRRYRRKMCLTMSTSRARELQCRLKTRNR